METFLDYERALDYIFARERIIRDRSRPLELSDSDIIRSTRFSRNTFTYLLNLLQDSLELSRRGAGVTVDVQLFVALKFFATGNDFYTIGRLNGLSKSGVAEIVWRVTKSLNKHSKELIVFPQETQSINATKLLFYEKFGFPNTVSILDGSHIPIIKPVKEGRIYFNRKGYYSINILVACDANLKITYLQAKYPGSCHDSYIVRNSSLSVLMEDYSLLADSWMLADKGFPLKKWLMVPIRNPPTNSHKRFNKALAAARCSIERCFGVLKNRFRCIHRLQNFLKFTPPKCCSIINAVCILHNVAISNCLDNSEYLNDHHDEEHSDEQVTEHECNTQLLMFRKRIVEQFFMD